MNHFLMLIILSLAVTIIFTLVSKDTTRERLHYFLKMLAYMVAGSLVGAWVMSAIPW